MYPPLKSWAGIRSPWKLSVNLSNQFPSEGPNLDFELTVIQENHPSCPRDRKLNLHVVAFPLLSEVPARISTRRRGWSSPIPLHSAHGSYATAIFSNDTSNSSILLGNLSDHSLDFSLNTPLETAFMDC